MEEVNQFVEPCIIHIRPGADSNDLRKQITEKLSKEHGFQNLDVNALIRDENERKTEIGKEMNNMVQSNKIIPAEMIVRMLRKIIYSGIPQRNKFILTSFPDIIEHAKEFETNCAKISAIIYSNLPRKDGDEAQQKVVQIKGNNLQLFNIDSLFQKEFRLRTMSEWDFSLFNQKLGNKIAFGVVIGRPFSGKTTIANRLAQLNSMTLIDMKVISEKLKASLGTEDEPFEGEVPIKLVEGEVLKLIREKRA
jgi:adenylate kinase family enzyme